MTDDASAGQAPGWQPVEGRPDRSRRVGLAIAALLALAVAVVVAVSFLPRWWAHRVGDRVRGSFTAGILTGLAVGAVCTAAALAVARLAFRRRTTWRRRAAALAVAVLLAAPNLTTLGIVLGNGSAAHAGERTLDVDAPGFRGATLIGAIAGLAAFVAIQWLLASRRRQKREVARLRDELRGRDAGPSAP